MPYAWNPAHQARVGLLRRDGSGPVSGDGGSGQVRWIDVDPCWIFHTLNAYDDGDQVVVDLSATRGPTTCPSSPGTGR